METYKKLIAGKEDVALRMFALPEQYGSGTTFHVDVVYVKDSSIDYVQSMGFYNNYYDEKHQYKGVCVVGLWYEDSSDVHGYEVQISDNHSGGVTFDKATAMLSVLKTINRKMTKLDIELGHHETFAEYICRLAKVLKAKSFYKKSTKVGNNDITEYRVDDITQLKDSIEQMIAFNVKVPEAA